MLNRNWQFNIFKNFAGDKIKPQMSDSLMQIEQVGMPDTLSLHFEMATITVTNVHCFVNLLLRAMISLVGGGGTCAVVGEIRAGSPVSRVQINMLCNWICVHSSPLHHVGNKNWDVFISFLLFHFFNVPLPSSWIVFARYNFVTRLRFFLWEVYMEIPVYSRELPSCFVSLITKI